MNTPKTADGVAVGSTDRFAPFDADGILCVQDGKITTDPSEDRDWTEYHMENMHGEVWRIERSDAAELCSFVYQGRIPDRAFFVAVMTNQETPLPDGWENVRHDPRAQRVGSMTWFGLFSLDSVTGANFKANPVCGRSFSCTLCFCPCSDRNERYANPRSCRPILGCGNGDIKLNSLMLLVGITLTGVYNERHYSFGFFHFQIRVSDS
jgi:hypothetical protein